MKILHISKYYFPFVGGVEQVARDCVNALKGHDNKVICFNHEKGDDTDIVDGVEVIRSGCQAKLSSQPIALGFGRALKKIMNEFQPEIVIFHYPNPFVAHSLLKFSSRNFKLILYWHLDIVKQKILKKFFHGQNKRLCDRADRIVATSPNYIEYSEYLPLYREKCTVIPNCVNTDRIFVNENVKKHEEQIRSENEGKIILFAVGRHVPYKGMEYLIRASAYLDDRFRIFIGGTGPLTESLKKLAEGDGKIKFTGKISDDELVAYMAACDIYCFPSITKNEAFGVSLAEAMYFGKPAVTFTIEGSGVNYVSLNGITGLEVENGNSEKYAEAIRLLADNEEMRLNYGKAARIRVENNFLLKNFAERLENLVDGLENK